ncbi:MAG: metallopeptidase family protein [Elusimicrobiota bacterium]|jgi:predicted Zn-dependent protease with MMP-like domain
MQVSPEEFDRLAEEAFSAIPAPIRECLYNVELDVRAHPGPEAGRLRGTRGLLGLHIGPSRAELLAAGDSPPQMPARILLYHRNIEADCPDLPELRRQIRLTLLHEIAHHFGIDDKELREQWPEGA